VRGPVELNIPVALDASASVAPEGQEIRVFEFAQDTNDAVRVSLAQRNPMDPVAVVTLTKEGDYHFRVRVGDGLRSGEPEVVRLRPHTSYQIVSDWTAESPTNLATYLQAVGPTDFERILKSTAAGEHRLVLVKDHEAGQVVTNLTVSVNQTNRQFWRVRYEAATKQLHCDAERLVEFAYRPGDDPSLKERKHVEMVNVAGSFNGWSPTATPMADLGDGTFVAYLKLSDGSHHYKFVVNDETWVQDPKADPDLRVDDGHYGFNSGLFIGEQGKDYGPAPTNDVNLAAVRHNARDFNVVEPDLVEVRLRTLHSDATGVTLKIDSRTVPMSVTAMANGFDYWSAAVFMAGTNQTVSYTFLLADGPVTRTFGEPFTASLAPKFSTPDWAKNVVWYQIFPERFRNGTTSNDPPHTLPWRWDWYKFADWEHPNDTKTFAGDWYSRKFGGDFQGVIEKLPYFRQLGVTALYFCPVFECSSSHGYDTKDYRHINRYFGVTEELPAETLDPATWKWTASDKLFLEFVRQAHAQGLKVIIDGVFNHMGKFSFAMQDVLTNGTRSAYADWFDVTDFGPPVKYNGWGGGDHLPNFRKDPNTGIASASARQYLFDITRRWMTPDGVASNGVDGWRLDVAPDVPAPFWVEWRKLVKGVNSNAYIVGEDWGVAASHLQGDQWDATMNYQFATRTVRFFIDKQRRITPTEFDRQLQQLLALYPLQVDFVMQNLYDSHDTDRLVSMIANPDRDYDGCNRPQDGCKYDGTKPGPEAYRVMKLMATFQMTFLGAPMIWYGDEAGMFGADDPTDRKPMLWRDLEPYDNPQDAVVPDVWNHYARLIAIRNTYPALRTGLYQSLYTDDIGDIFGFARARGDQPVAVLLNNSDNKYSADIPVPFPTGTRLVDVLNAPAEIVDARLPEFSDPVHVLKLSAHAPATVVREGKVHVDLPAKSAAIFVKQ
jgi:glycosidase